MDPIKEVRLRTHLWGGIVYIFFVLELQTNLEQIRAVWDGGAEIGFTLFAYGFALMVHLILLRLCVNAEVRVILENGGGGQRNRRRDNDGGEDPTLNWQGSSFNAGWRRKMQDARKYRGD